MSPSSPPQTTLDLALLGFGNVGRAFAELIQEKETDLQDDFGLALRVVGIATGSHGAAVNPSGIPLEEALGLVRDGSSLNELSVEPISGSGEFIQRCPADVLLETTPVSYQDGQPALDYLSSALQQGMHAVTANKGPVVHGYRKLSALARAVGKSFFFESAVMDGAPVFSIGRCGMPGARVNAIRGVFNSTTNLILTQMEEGRSFEEAVAYTQEIGIAETDPSGDIDGWDAAIKTAALVTVLMDIPLTPDQVQRTGIREITREQVAAASAEDQRWKLACSARRSSANPAGVEAVVQPELVDAASPLYHVTGTSAVLEIESDVLGKLSLREDHPSPRTTAYGLLADLLNAVRSDPALL
jgi:homoserine dehydrogenase